MKALILAGGFGTRLRPLTNTRPKHLLPIANVPHIDHVLHLLRSHGIDEIVLLTSYLAEAFAEVATAARSSGMLVEVTHEPEPLGTAGALKNAQALLSDETFVAFNGDILTDVDLTGVLGFHRERRAEATIVLTPVEDPSAFGVVPTGPDGRVTGFIEKPAREDAPTNLINAGIYVMEPSILGRIPAGVNWSAERSLFPGLVDEGARLFALGTDAYWMDIGTPQKYLQANLDALAGRYQSPLGSAAEGDHVVAGDRVVTEGGRVSWACLGPGVIIENGASVERSVLLPGVFVGAGAAVRDSVLGENAHIAPGATVAGMTIADNDRVGI